MPSGEIFLEQIYHTEGNVEGNNKTGTTLASPANDDAAYGSHLPVRVFFSKESITLILFAALLF